MARHTGAGMLFVIVTVRFFDYDYAQEHKHESGNPGGREARKNRKSSRVPAAAQAQVFSGEAAPPAAIPEDRAGPY
jgi:hypothetical protein